MATEKLRKRIAGNRIYATVAEKDRNLDNIVMADKADKVAAATNNHLASLNASGNLKDSGKSASDFATAAQGTLASTAVQDVKIGNTSLKDGSNVATIPDMTGATESATGTAGLVPAPAAGDQGKFLKGDGTWTTIEIAEQKVHVLSKTTGLTSTEFDQAWVWLENGHLVGVWYDINGYKYLFLADKYYTPSYGPLQNTIVFSYIRNPVPLENQYEGMNRDTLSWIKSGSELTWKTISIMPSPLNQFGRCLYTNGQGGAPYWKEIKEVPSSTASDSGKILTVNSSGNAAWSTVSPYAPAPSANNVLLLGDATGGKTWTALENDVFGTPLLDENDQPILDEESTQDNPIYVYDAGSTDQLWTGFAGKGFGAIRTYADQDGHNIKATYATKEDLNAALGNIEALLATL